RYEARWIWNLPEDNDSGSEARRWNRAVPEAFLRRESGGGLTYRKR
ncbi:hypothetical protein A2U01_0019769, partial [Trifolium medium]|nr:hypothetical protein [Trifolium medium]